MRIFTIIVLATGIHMVAHASEWQSRFETGDFSGWTTQGSGWSISNKSALSGNCSAMCSVSKGEAPHLKACAHLIEKAEAGWVVKADLWIAGKNKSESSVFTASIVCIDSGGSILREVKKKLSKPDRAAQQLTLPEIIIPSGTAETYLMLVVEVTQEARGNEWWKFDDITVLIK